jgi:endonuclease/exonuclease/phosphatase family metal-dependent hydrolase
MKRSLLCLLMVIAATASGRKMVVGTYNLRYDNKGDALAGNGWDKRAPVIAGIIRARDIDILGTQEGLSHQLIHLKELRPGYNYIGVGRDDGKDAGEHSAIFYKRDKYEVLDHGDFWLSPVTNRPNKGWDAALPRICTWGKFRERRTGFRFYCFNLHMDHVGVVARRESAKLVLDTIRKMTGRIPVILMGDFNVDQHDTSYALLANSGFIKDAFVLAPAHYGAGGTFNSFDTNRHSDSRIDHIFLNKAFAVRRYEVSDTAYHTRVDVGSEVTARRFPSDHFPVIVVLEY